MATTTRNPAGDLLDALRSDISFLSHHIKMHGEAMRALADLTRPSEADPTRIEPTCRRVDLAALFEVIGGGITLLADELAAYSVTPKATRTEGTSK